MASYLLNHPLVRLFARVVFDGVGKVLNENVEKFK